MITLDPKGREYVYKPRFDKEPPFNPEWTRELVGITLFGVGLIGFLIYISA